MRILVGGLARSGTTWFARALAAAPGVQYIHEPDTRGNDPFAYIGTRGIRFQEPFEPGTHVPNYELMWDVAFAGGWPRNLPARVARRAVMHPRLPDAVARTASTALARLVRRRRPPTEHQLVKSVRVVMTIEWLADRYQPKVIVVWRNPLNMLSSYRERKEAGATGTAVHRRYSETPAWPAPTDPDGNVIWTICARLGLLLETTKRHPEWLVIRHEHTASDPFVRFKHIFHQLSLPWSSGVDAFLNASNRPGTGWETNRVASREPTRWKERLSAEQIHISGEVLRRFSEVPGMGPVFAECLAEME